MKKHISVIFFIFIFIPTFAQADSIKLLEDPHDAWQARLDLIAQAQDTIEVEYYSIASDTAGTVFIGMLCEAAQRGVKVRLLVGGLTHAVIADDTIGMLVEHPNVEIRFYHSMKKWYKPSHWLKHLHDKILLVDNRYLITGGRNIADKYFDMTPPEKQQTIDRDILIVADKKAENIPLQVKAYFNDLWESDAVDVTPTELHITRPCFGTPRLLFTDFFTCSFHKKKLEKNIPKKQEECIAFMQQYKAENAEQFNAPENWTQTAKSAQSIEFAHDPIDVSKSYDNGTALALSQQLRDAKRSILYFTPYIVKAKDYLKTAEIAQGDGVEQTVLTNSSYSGANLFGKAGTEFYYEDFSKLGLTYWTYQGFHSLHHKTYIIDDHITISSTYNYDPRSENLNTEMLFIVDDKDFTDEVKKANQVFFDKALELDEKGDAIVSGSIEEGKVSLWNRATLTVAKLFMPFIRWAI